MLRSNPSGISPIISKTAFIDPTAIICGHVIIEEGVFVGPYAVIRADEIDATGNMEPIIIRRDSNIQDGVVIHSLSGAAVTIGQRTSIAHRSIIHGPCEVGDDVFIGFNTVVFRSHINNGCVIHHNCVIEGVELPVQMHVQSMSNIDPNFDHSQLKQVPYNGSTFSKSVVAANQRLVKGYKKLANGL